MNLCANYCGSRHDIPKRLTGIAESRCKEDHHHHATEQPPAKVSCYGCRRDQDEAMLGMEVRSYRKKLASYPTHIVFLTVFPKKSLLYSMRA
jgi:hypothetical protein